MKLRCLALLPLLLTAGLTAQNTRNTTFYLDAGVKNSPLLIDNFNQLEASRIDSLKLRASQKPQLNVFSTAQVAPNINGQGYDEAVTNGGTYIAGVQAAVPLLNGRIIKAEYENASVQRRTLENSTKLSRHDLEKQILDQYLLAYQGYAQMSFTSRIVETLSHETAVLKELFQKGVGKQTDYMSVSIELQSQQILLEDLNTQYRSAVILLNSICGINDTAAVQLATPDLKLKTEYNLSSSPLFYKFSLDSLGFESQHRIVDARYKPHLNLFGDAGLNTSHLLGIQQTLGFSLGLNLLMPLYDGHQRTLDHRKLDLGQRTRKGYRDYFLTKYFLQLAQLSKEIASNDRIIARLQQQQRDAELLLKLTRQQFANGLATTTDYVIALRNHLSISNDLNSATIKKQLLINENNYWTW